MSKSTFLLCFLLIPALLAAQKSTPTRYSRVRIDLHGRPMSELARLGIEADHGDWVAGQFFQTDLSQTELALVQKAGFQTSILVPDVIAQYEKDLKEHQNVALRSKPCPGVNPAYTTPSNYTYGSMGGYHTYAEMLAVLDDMAAKFPTLITQRAMVSDTILTHEGRPQWYVKISDNPQMGEAEPQVLFTALHHAREPNSMSQMLFFMWYLLEHYDTDAEVRYLLDNEELYFIPCVNPDGYIYNETTNPGGGGLWRKNRLMVNDSTYGVDLNRNYGFQWGIDDQGSSPEPTYETYRGPAPFSEPETRMVRDFCQAHDFVFTQNYHTKGNLLIYPWAYNATLADSSLWYFARLFTRENQYKTGITFETVGYAVNGSAEDWMHAERGISSFTPEVGRGGFWPMPDEIDGYNKANLWQNWTTALCALRFGTVDDRSENYQSSLNFDLPMRLTRYGFQDGPFKVSLQALSANVSAVSPASFTLDLQQFKSKDFAFSASLAPSVQIGEAALFLLRMESGGFVHTDTLRKFYGGTTKSLFSENGNNTLKWTGSWKPTTQSYVSAPASITDSPNTTYPPNANTSLLLTNSIQIPAGARQPVLRFWARWDIEDNYDYVVVQGTGQNQIAVPLCGLHTNPASNAQSGGGFPLYDGLQPTWVEEKMDVSDFIGQPFKVSFRLRSDNGQEFDGFYFDDLRVEYTDPTLLKTVVLPLQDFQIKQNEPNPATEETTIVWNNHQQVGGIADFLVFDLLGQVYAQTPVDLDAQSAVSLDTKSWPAGIYSYCIRGPLWQTALKRMVVVR